MLSNVVANVMKGPWRSPFVGQLEYNSSIASRLAYCYSAA